MTQHQIICAIAEMKDITIMEAYIIYKREEAKGYESFIDFLESIAEWYYDL